MRGGRRSCSGASLLTLVLGAMGCARASAPAPAPPPAPPPAVERPATVEPEGPAEEAAREATLGPARPPSAPAGAEALGEPPAPALPPPGPTEGPLSPAAAPAPAVEDLRQAVGLARRDADRACRGRRASSTECALARVELVTCVTSLATVLGCRLEPRRLQAIERLADLVEAVAEARAAIDPHVLRDCLREGGDEADCELLDGQQYSELGAAEHELERAYGTASPERIRDDCAPSDDDLAVQLE